MPPVTLSSLNDGNQGSDRYGSAYGWEQFFFVSTGETIWVGHWYESSWYMGSQRQAYLQVNLDDLPDSEWITQAMLYLYIESYDNASEPADTLSHVNSSTTNGKASQKLLTAVGGSHAISNASGTGCMFDFTSDIVGDHDAGYTHSVFRMASGSYRGLTFLSADYSNPDFRPYLEVTIIPEPAHATLVLGLLVVAVCVILRKHQT